MLATVTLVASMIGAMPGIALETFHSRRDCQEFHQLGGGWLLLGSWLGMAESPDPIPGWEMHCVEKT